MFVIAQLTVKKERECRDNDADKEYHPPAILKRAAYGVLQ